MAPDRNYAIAQRIAGTLSTHAAYGRRARENSPREYRRRSPRQASIALEPSKWDIPSTRYPSEPGSVLLSTLKALEGNSEARLTWAIPRATCTQIAAPPERVGASVVRIRNNADSGRTTQWWGAQTQANTHWAQPSCSQGAQPPLPLAGRWRAQDGIQKSTRCVLGR